MTRHRFGTQEWLLAEPIAAGKSGDGELLAEIPTLDGALWQLSLMPLTRLNSKLGDSIAALAEQCAGENPFFHPVFLNAGRNRVLPRPQSLLLVSVRHGAETRLKFLLPVTEEPETWLLPHHLRAASHEYAPLGNPLVDLGDIDETMSRLCQLLAEAFAGGMTPLLIDDVTGISHFAKSLPAHAAPAGLTNLSIAKPPRAALLAGNSPNDIRISAKRRREFRRYRRKLEAAGVVTFERAVSLADVLVRFEEFLLMEAKGWKGRRGTSMQGLKRTAAFARQSVTDFAPGGNAEIFSLRLDGDAIASLIVFEFDGAYFPWKIAFSERHAGFSPGGILMNAVSEEIGARPGFRFADSLARPGRSWMNLLWPDTLTLETLILGGADGAAENLAEAIARQHRVKALAKRLLRRR